MVRILKINNFQFHLCIHKKLSHIYSGACRLHIEVRNTKFLYKGSILVCLFQFTARTCRTWNLSCMQNCKIAELYICFLLNDHIHSGKPFPVTSQLGSMHATYLFMSDMLHARLTLPFKCAQL